MQKEQKTNGKNCLKLQCSKNSRITFYTIPIFFFNNTAEKNALISRRWFPKFRVNFHPIITQKLNYVGRKKNPKCIYFIYV